MRVAVVGAGAIGGFIAAALARAGAGVTVVARGAHLEAIQRSGIEIASSDLGAFISRVDAVDDARKLPPVDVALLTFKAHQWPQLLPQLHPLAKAGTPVVTLQNGVPFWFARSPALRTVDPGGRIGAAFGDRRIIGGVVHVSGNVARPGVVHQSGGTRYRLGELDASASERLRHLIEQFQDAGLQAEFDPNIRETVWLKLVNNAALNPVSAMTGMTIGPMLRDAQSLAEVRTLMNEAIAIGRALGVVGAVNVDERIALASRLADVKTSMLQDLEAKRPLELDPILGALVELADRKHVASPHLRSAYESLCARSGME